MEKKMFGILSLVHLSVGAMGSYWQVHLRQGLLKPKKIELGDGLMTN